MKKYFNKNLIISKEEEQFQWSNTCWICEKLIDDDDEKVRDHCHVTGKFWFLMSLKILMWKLT